MKKKTLNHLIPPFFKPLLKKHMDGPNCWSATIKFHEPSKNLRFVSGSSMDKWLKNKTKKTNKPQYGDILVFRASTCQNDADPVSRQTNLVHTAVLISDDYVFHKAGVFGKFEITSFTKAKELYPEATRFEWRRIIKQSL